MVVDNGQKIQRTFTVKDEKITIKSNFSHRKIGFIVDINGEKLFNNGSTNNSYPVDTSYGDWRELAEARCFKQWLDKKAEKIKTIAEDLLGTCNHLDISEFSQQECIWLDEIAVSCSVCGWWVEPHEANMEHDIICLDCVEE